MNSNLSTSPFSDDRVTVTYSYKQWREQFLLIILRLACVLGVVLIASALNATAADRVFFLSLYGALLVVTFAPVPYIVRAYFLLGVLYIVGVNVVINWGPWIDGSVFFLTFITLSALLFDDRTDIVAIILSTLPFLIVGTLQAVGLYEFKELWRFETNYKDWIGYVVDLLVPAVTIVFAVRKFKQEFANIAQKMQETFDELTKQRLQLEDRVSERTNELEARATQLRSTTVLARTVAEIKNIEELINTLTEMTASQFDYYHVGLYMLDENKKTAFMQSSSSAAGKALIGQGFHVEPSKRNPMYLVVDQNRYYISSDADQTQFFNDPNFPLTRSRMMLPLAIRGAVIGILDIHSEQTQAFTSQDAEILQSLADLAAISIDNVRLIDEARNLVNQLEASSSFQARETWSKLTSRHSPAYQYTPAGVRPIFSPKKFSATEDSESLNVSLKLHGQSIGTIKLRRKGVAAKWSERERDLVEKIASQVALALENSRLVDEAKRNALRDQMITNVSSNVRETLQIESVIRTAATELRKVFDLKEAEITVGIPQSDKKHTSVLRSK